MKNLDSIAREKAEAAAEAQAKEQERQQFRQSLESAAKGEHLSEDFEPIAAEGGRTFSQEEVNSIVRERLAKARAKYGEATTAMTGKLSEYETTLTEREKQLAASEHRHKAEKALFERGIDSNDEMLKLVMGADVDETIEKIEQLSYLMAQPQKPKDDGDIIREVMGLHDLK